MMLSDVQNHNNKENRSMTMNIDKESNYKVIRPKKQWFQSRYLDSDSDIEQIELALVKMKKKKYLKIMIAQTLRLRKQLEVNLSRIQICQDHKKFKVFARWKTISDLSQKVKAEVEAMRETKQFDFLRRCFKIWVEFVTKPRKELLQRKRQLFEAFKIECGIQLSLRIRRITLQEILIHKRGKQALKLLSGQTFKVKKQTERAKVYRRIKLLSTTFDALYQQSTQQRSQKLRYQKYKLAHLFHKKTLMLLYFKRFKYWTLTN